MGTCSSNMATSKVNKYVSLVGACLFRPPQTTKHGQIVELPGHAHIFLRIRAFLKMLETMEFREFIFLGSKI